MTKLEDLKKLGEEENKSEITEAIEISAEKETAEEIREKITKLIQGKDKLTSEIWDYIFTTRENVVVYLEILGIKDKDWKIGKWLRRNGYRSFYSQVSESTDNKRFKSWDEFLIWMGEEVEEKIDWDEIFKSPKNARDYLKKEGLLENNWRSSSWLEEKGYQKFYIQVVKTTTKERQRPRFKSWKDFLVWMGEIEKNTNWNKLFKAPENVKKYFEEEKIDNENWMSSGWLSKNGYQFFYYQATQSKIKEQKPRFNSWNDFLVWMGEREEIEEKQILVSDEIIQDIREGIEDEF